jgi:hypothetical protein
MGTPLATARGTDLLTARRLKRIDNAPPLAALIQLPPRWILHPQPIGLDGEEIETVCELKDLSFDEHTVKSCGILRLLPSVVVSATSIFDFSSIRHSL